MCAKTSNPNFANMKAIPNPCPPFFEEKKFQQMQLAVSILLDINLKKHVTTSDILNCILLIFIHL
jgi:hypothetical protein